MDSTPSTEVTHDFHPCFRVYKDGRVERFFDTPFVPASDDPNAAVRSKDVVVSPETNVSARLYLPKTTTAGQKLPLLIYIHGGGFSFQSAFSTLYHPYLNSLVAEANVVAVSVEYRLAPENSIPACYDDTWTVLKWVARHADKGPEPWLSDHADFGRVFLAGDSAGANISHNMMVRYSGDGGLGIGVKIVGMVLVHPYFGKKDQPTKMWEHICPDSSGLGDPRFNPAAAPGLLSELGCSKVLIIVAAKDPLRERGWTYYEALKESGWGGDVKFVETKEEEHVFHLFNPNCDKAVMMLKLVASFINNNPPSLL